MPSALDRHIIISGCSGGGKSSLLEVLRRRGEVVIDEPGRRIVCEELATDGSSLPWVNPAAFARRAILLSKQDRHAIETSSAPVFFDRGLIDAAIALEHATGEPVVHTLYGQLAFYRQVFFAPPWPEIYQRDVQRQHVFDDAIEEYVRLTAAYPKLGYEIVLLPKTSADERADFVQSTVSKSDNPLSSDKV